MYVGMNGPKKKKRRRTSCGELHKVTGSSQPEQPFTKSNDAAGKAFSSQVHNSNPDLPHIGLECGVVLESELPVASSPEYASKEADLICEATLLEGDTLETLLPEDASDVMTEVILTATKVWTQIIKFDSSEILLGITTNIDKVYKYTEQ